MKKTQGQKRKRIVNIIVLAIFLITTGLGVFVYQKVMGAAYSWVGEHAVVHATVTNLDKTVDEYRNFKGRKRTDTIFYVEYSFIVDGETIASGEEITSLQYKQMSIGDKVSVWYDSTEPYVNALESSVDNGEATSPITALISVVPVTIGIAFFMHFLLGFLFVRESRTTLSDGFYTEDSWLDVDDNKLVLLNNYLVAVASFDDNQVKPITQAYQDNVSHKELIALLKTDQLKTAVLANITSLHSRHDEDLILLAEGENKINLDFLNIGTKAHALERLEAKLPATLNRTQITRSRMRSAMPRLGILALLAVLGLYMSNPGVWFVIGFLTVVLILPNLVRRLISPTIVTTYEQKSAQLESDEPALNESNTDDLVPGAAA